MAAPFQVQSTLGVDLARVVTAVNIAAGAEAPTHALGTVVVGSDGKTYVYGKAGATITTATAVCLPSATTFVVAASGGSYTSPVLGMVINDYGWFSKALV